ncbi:immunoglobulin superfamily member 5 [Pholidichthys leucotaenia]
MTVFQLPNLESLFCPVVSGQFQLEPLNSTVLQGSEVHFNATIQGDWQIMTWEVGGFLVLTVSEASGVIPTERFSARFCSSDNSSCVEFTIHNATRGDAGPVICTIQGAYGQRTSQLYVEENGSVSVTGEKLKVEQEQEVEFQCVATGWFPSPTVSWSLNGGAVDSSLYNTSFTADGDSYNSTSVLKFQAVRNTTVECLVSVPTMINPQSSSVVLVVVPKPTDWTVLIAVVVSFGGFALLVLLIIGIIFCYKRRKEKEPNYDNEMRRVRTQSQLSNVNKPGQKQGQVNASYEPEGRTSVTGTDSGFSQTNESHISEMRDVVNSNHVGHGPGSASLNVDDLDCRTHRHATIV